MEQPLANATRPDTGLRHARSPTAFSVVRGAGRSCRWQTRSMTSRIAAISIDALDPRRVAEFWCAVLGWEIRNLDSTGADIGPPDGSWPTVDIGRVPEKKSVKNRLHLDIRADGSAQSDELRRLLDLGAQRVDVGQTSDSTWVVLADPEGNDSVAVPFRAGGSWRIVSGHSTCAPFPTGSRSVATVACRENM